MKFTRSATTFGLALATVALLAPAPVLAQDAAQQGAFHDDPQLTEWMVPYEQSRPRDPFVAPDGKVWFVGQRSHYVASLDPATGDFRKIDLEDGTGPHNLVVGDDGIIWYAGNRSGHHIGRVDPATGEIRKFMIEDERVRDPHTLVWAPDNTIWFTAQQANFVGHFNPATGEYRVVEMPRAEGRGGRMTGTNPYGIKMDSRAHPWIVLFRSNRIATVDPATMQPRYFDLPDERSRPRRLVIDSKDQVWYVDYALGRLGKLDPASGEVTEWPMPGGEGAQPYGVAIDPADRIWFVETGVDPNHFVGFDPATQEFFSRTPIESGGGTVRHMHYDPKTNTVWFGADTNTIGRAVLPPLRRITSQ